MVSYGDCKTLVEKLQTRAIAVAIASAGLQFYESGIFKPDNYIINHGVTLIGYHSPTKGYLIKNSWGPNWGKIGSGTGYVDISSGVCSYAMYPNI